MFQSRSYKQDCIAVAVGVFTCTPLCHYPKQCWPIASKVQWQFSQGSLIKKISQRLITEFILKIVYLKLHSEMLYQQHRAQSSESWSPLSSSGISSPADQCLDETRHASLSLPWASLLRHHISPKEFRSICSEDNIASDTIICHFLK